ncbi:MAG: prephenate dehydrogenase/arogenate dehydrogenase family protein [Pseudomonadota bacterium]
MQKTVDAPDPGFHLKTLLIVGVGLIGGSLAMALKKAGVVDRVIGFGRSETNLNKALALGAIDEVGDDLGVAASQADLICVATPVNTMAALFEIIAAHMKSTAIVTDVGSVKAGVVAQARLAMKHNVGHFVPGHPIAGKEKSGVEAAMPGLFENHKVVLTPLPENQPEQIVFMRSMWRICGADVIEMTIEAHDRVLSLTSHLPHVLAYATVQQLAQSEDRESCYEMAAGGFYDFTRIASGDPDMWRDICLLNRKELLNQLRQYQSDLAHLTDLIEKGDGEKIKDIFLSSQKARSVLVERRERAPDMDS